MANLVRFSCCLCCKSSFELNGISIKIFSGIIFLLLFLTSYYISHKFGYCVLGIFPAESYTWCLDSQTSSGKIVRFISHNWVSALPVLDLSVELYQTSHNVSVLLGCYQIFVKSIFVCLKLKILCNILISPPLYHTE